MASYTKERKKEIDCVQVIQESMPRNNSKPQMKFYTPGSGPLRKTENKIEDHNNDNGTHINKSRYTAANRSIKTKNDLSPSRNDNIESSTSKMAELSINDKKRTRKPEQPLFVPTVVAKARENEQKLQNEVHKYENPKNDNHYNGSNQNNDRNNSHNNKSKRYSSRRKINGSNNHEEWRNNSPNRNFRQGSEPRSIHQNTSNWNRTRDTRSVEPQINTTGNKNYSSEKSHMKPPSGRRHSTIGVEKPPKNFENLPPRLQKKYLLEENRPSCTSLTEESWDGMSITFQGSSSQHPSYQQSKPLNFVSNQHVTPNNMVYCTLPNRARGRGRLQQDSYNPGAMHRSMTPDKMYMHSPATSRPATPTNFASRTRSNESLNRVDAKPPTQNLFRNIRSERNFNNNDRRNDNEFYDSKRSQRNVNDGRITNKFRDSLEAQLSPVSPATPEEKVKLEVTTSNVILDWSEEVELHEKNLEAEASDALTRSSSMASLRESTTKSHNVQNSNTRHRKKKSKRHRRSGSANRDRSIESNRDGKNYSRQRQNSHTSVESRDFKIPESRRNRRGDMRDRSYDRKNRSRNQSRESSFDRHRKSSCSEHENVNWRDEIKARNSEREISRKSLQRDIKKDGDVKKGGIIHLPPNLSIKEAPKPPAFTANERPKVPDVQRKSPGQRTLYDPNNPNKPIIINKPNSRDGCPSYNESSENQNVPAYVTDQYGNVKPGWLTEYSDGFNSCRYPDVLRQVRKIDIEMQAYCNLNMLSTHWEYINERRLYLMDTLRYLLTEDIKFAQTENIETYFWKILFYNIIEMVRKAMETPLENREQYKKFVIHLIDEGKDFYESLLDALEKKFEFKISDYIGNNWHNRIAGTITLVLLSVHKIYICLGDLGRYRELVNETTNYGKCQKFYVKAHEINPKYGRPYYQLAVLAVYSRKKLDAVYYYMRSLMSKNPVQPAREKLEQLFYENRRKYEHRECKRREERSERARHLMKEKESQHPKNKHGPLRKETWIRPDGGPRLHRINSTLHETKVDSEEEDLAALTSVEVNKRFVISYLHVHEKLITKVGMETFQETAMQMLKEFRALLQHTPVPLTSLRFLQLLALNMFAIESTQLKDHPNFQGFRSELQERALVVSLQMFSLILEKCISLFHEHMNKNPDNFNANIPTDLNELLPSVKIWCDWMLCHTSIWNPPPSTQDFRVGPSGDPWTRIAALMNILEKVYEEPPFIDDPREGYKQVCLPEDGALSGFTPLSLNDDKPTYVPKDFDMDTAQFFLRLQKLLFFGTTYLCGSVPQVLKFEYASGGYVSVVCTTASRSTPNTPPEFNESELLVESFSDEEIVKNDTTNVLENTSNEIQELISRKVELEKRQRDQELHRQTVQLILQQSVVSVHIEVKPKNLVPDTNCFIDHLPMLKSIASSSVYTLMVPLIVLNELEGLAKGSKSPVSSPRYVVDPMHVIKVAEAAKFALEFLSNRHPFVKCVTTKGTILTSTIFTKEDDTLVDVNMTNDDRILATCMTLCKGGGGAGQGQEQVAEGEPRKIHREVVLLTEDKNLKVKALAMDVPVCEVPNFLQWAGLG